MKSIFKCAFRREKCWKRTKSKRFEIYAFYEIDDAANLYTQLNNRNIFCFEGDVLWFPCENLCIDHFHYSFVYSLPLSLPPPRYLFPGISIVRCVLYGVCPNVRYLAQSSIVFNGEPNCFWSTNVSCVLNWTRLPSPYLAYVCVRIGYDSYTVTAMHSVIVNTLLT